MLSFSPRSLLALSLLFSLAVCSRAETPASRPTAKQIAQWIEQLGDNDFATREKASKKLWQAGSAAELALEKASKSDDPEVVRRARELLDKFQWGIYPDTPADIVALIRAYQSSVGKPRMDVLQKLLDGGDSGFRAAVKIAAAEKDENQRRVLSFLIANQLSAVFLKAVTEEKHEHFERLLEIGHEGKLAGHTLYAAYWLLCGKLKERITHFEAQLRDHPKDKWVAQTLAYLHRANGDLLEAHKAAEKSDRADLMEGILYEAGDWKALTARAEGRAKENPSEKGGYHIAGTTDPAEEWAYRTAFARLAGKQKEFDNAVGELRKFAEGGSDRNASAFEAAKGLLLNDRPTDGLFLLQGIPNRRVLLFDLLCARLDFTAALDLAVKLPPEKELSLAPARARLLCLLGDKDGEALFERCGERIKDGVDPEWVELLLTEEIRAGLKDRAFVHAAKALSVAGPATAGGSVFRDGKTREEHYLAQLFPQHATTAGLWWHMLRRQFEHESPAVVMKRLRELMEGKSAAKDVKVWIKHSEDFLRSGNLKLFTWPPMDAWEPALAEAAIRAGLDTLAASLLEKTESRDALLRLGDLLASTNQWDKAAERYQQAWKKEVADIARANLRSFQGKTADPLSLYLAGDALVRADREKEGRKLIDQSHWIPLADAATRFRFFQALGQRGHSEAAQREMELIRRVSEPNSYYLGEALRQRALAARKRKEYLPAALGFEQSILRCLRGGTSFVNNASYVNAPAQIHQLRAQGLLAAGKLDEALKQVELALSASPGYVNLPIALVPQLERSGHKKEATDLFNRCYGAYEKVCRDYPRCAWAHNLTAWLSACCRRHLDQAQQHAEKAIALAPNNAGYVDTLAEVHFQRGDKDKAIALEKRAVELDPKRSYYRLQLKRLEAGDPSAERPPENDAD